MGTEATTAKVEVDVYLNLVHNLLMRGWGIYPAISPTHKEVRTKMEMVPPAGYVEGTRVLPEALGGFTLRLGAPANRSITGTVLLEVLKEYYDLGNSNIYLEFPKRALGPIEEPKMVFFKLFYDFSY